MLMLCSYVCINRESYMCVYTCICVYILMLVYTDADFLQMKIFCFGLHWTDNNDCFDLHMMVNNIHKMTRCVSKGDNVLY